MEKCRTRLRPALLRKNVEQGKKGRNDGGARYVHGGGSSGKTPGIGDGIANGPGKNVEGGNNTGARYVHGGGTCGKTHCIGDGIASRQVSTANKSHKKEEKEQTEKGRKRTKIIWACE